MNDDTLNTEVAINPLTDWKNRPSVRDLKQDLQDAKSDHDGQVSQIDEWLDNLHVRNKAKVKVPAGNSQIVPRLIRKQAEWRYSALSEPFLTTDELFKVSPQSWEDRKAAQQNQLLLNSQFNYSVDKVTFIDEFVRAAVDEGTVILRTGWEFIEEEYTGTFPVVQFQVNPELGPMHEQLAQMKAESPADYMTDVPEELRQAHDMTIERGEPIEPVITGQKEETRTRTVCNKPTVEVCDFRNVTIDPTALGDIEKAGFVVYSFESSKSLLMKEGKKYQNLEHINISANSILGQGDHETSEGGKTFNFSDDARKKFVVHEYWGFWDIHGTGETKAIVAAWVGDTMIRLAENPYPDKKIPFITVPYLPVRKSVYGEPDGALLEDNQKIVGAVTRGMIDIMGKSANGQTGMRKDMLDATNRRKFDQGKDYEFNPNVDPKQGVHTHVYPEIPASAQFMLQLQNLDAESMTGVKSFANTGVSGAAFGDVAALGRGALDAASKREMGILRRLSNGMMKVARKWISMNAEFLSDNEVVRITNEQFVTVKKDDLPGNFTLKLSISTAEEDAAKAQELAFMLQTTGNGMDPELQKMILSDIARLRKMPDLAKKIETYVPQPDPLMQEKLQLEVELLRAQIFKENALAQQAGATAQLNVAKVDTEGAKAANLASDTDQKNLDFVEQESGVKQERDLQKVGEQARSQAQLKVIDHQFKRQEAVEDRKTDLVKEFLKNSQKKAA